MKISRNWLQTYFKEKLPDSDSLWNDFTFHLCEVESIDTQDTDTVFDINILPNRAHDCLCHRGVARELSAILEKQIFEEKIENTQGQPTQLKIVVNTPNCRRYIGRIVRNISIGDTPVLIKDKLLSIGQKTINSAVDISNFVLFDKGQPVHIFDLDKIIGEEIFVRQGNDTEVLTTLDGKDIKIDQSMTIISDSQFPLALAGVKGGTRAEVTRDTKNILIEVANFDPISTRKTARKQSLLTDAAKRFENDLSPDLCSEAMNEVTSLILEACKNSNTSVEEVVDVYPSPLLSASINVSTENINKKLGASFTDAEIENVFKRLNFQYTKNSNQYTIMPDMLRLDLKNSEDIVEEVGRVIGYEKISLDLPRINFVPKINSEFYKILFARKFLLKQGFSEVMTYTLSKKGVREVARGPKGKSFLRKNISDGLHESLKLNRLNAPLLELSEIKIFEIGTIFLEDSEEMHVAWGDAHEIFEMTLDEFCEKESLLVSDNYSSLVFSVSDKKFTPWSPYPFIVRDISIWMDEKYDESYIKKLIEDEVPKNILGKAVHVVDVFEKEQKISKTFRVIFQSYEKTLTDNDVFDIISSVNNKISILGLKIR